MELPSISGLPAMSAGKRLTVPQSSPLEASRRRSLRSRPCRQFDCRQVVNADRPTFLAAASDASLTAGQTVLIGSTLQ